MEDRNATMPRVSSIVLAEIYQQLSAKLPLRFMLNYSAANAIAIVDRSGKGRGATVTIYADHVEVCDNPARSELIERFSFQDAELCEHVVGRALAAAMIAN
jgi:hypothetical protein